MSENLSPDILWNALTPAEVETGARTLLAGKYPGGRDDADQALAAVATARRFRSSFLRRRKPEQNMPLLLPLLRQGTDLRLRLDVVKAWLIGEHLAMFSQFLDSAGVAHQDGFVEDDAPNMTKDQVKKAITEVAPQHPPRAVAVYLGLQIFAGGEFSAALGPALEELDWPLLENLQGEPKPAE